MRILFVHNNFPGQYRRITKYISDRPKLGVEMFAATLSSNTQPNDCKQTIRFKPHREVKEGTHPALISTERALLNGQALYGSLMQSRKTGFSPDVIMSHSGWGSAMFLRDLFPDAKFLTYYEWYYHAVNSDGAFLMDEPYDPNNQLRIRMKNTPILQDMVAMDHGQCPTHFQHSQLPTAFQDNISVLHDGVDTKYFKPNPKAKVTFGGHVFTAEDEVITYVARGMEEYRGFPQFMRTVALLQKQRPNLQVLILGNDRVAYGSKRTDGKTWKEAMLEELDLDESRLHFMGLQPLDVFQAAMQITSAHIYLTVPFVLSWSLLEAMSAGALIVGSDTAPVAEVIADGENGVIVPFFEPEAIAEKVVHILEHQAEYAPLKIAARKKMVESYATKDLLPKYWQLIKSVANGTQV